jgi:multicomponent Na+:H+ antiporter subunit D
MLGGMSGAFLTGDLFNLFVMFEIVLMSSYAMVSYSGTRESLFTSLKYVVLNLIGSSLMLVAIGGLYSVTGTLNMADMALILSEGSVNTAPVLGLSAILFCVFAIKSGLVPFHFWAPPVYSNSPPPAAAMMAAISKKVGIYAVIRLYFTVFSQASIPQTAAILAGKPVTHFIAPVILVMATATIILGGISAINRKNLDKMLSYSSVGQVGFIFIPVGLAMLNPSKMAIAASLIYLMSHSLSKSSLFMVSGLVEKITGETDLEEINGLSETSGFISAAYFISAFSLVGIPPLLGFFGKFSVLRASIMSGNQMAILVVLFGSLMTLTYFGKSWLKAFFGEPEEYSLEPVSRLEILAVLFLAVEIIFLGLNLEPLYGIAEAAAGNVVNPETYITSVMEGVR